MPALGTSTLLPLLPAVPLLAAAAAYLTGMLRLRRRGVRWPPARAAAAAGGLACLGVALLPPLVVRDEEFTVHAAQHLLLGMAAPLLLALSAPVTLALRAVPAAVRPRLVALLHSSPVQLLTRPWLVLLLNVGGMYALYLTPLYPVAARHPALHVAVHLHMVGAGCLLSWLLVGPDPVPYRPGLRGRLAVLLIAAAAHDTLAKLLYARGVGAGAPAAAAGAQLMYYGGDAVEVLLAVGMLAQWYAYSGRSLRAERRRLERVRRAQVENRHQRQVREPAQRAAQ